MEKRILNKIVIGWFIVVPVFAYAQNIGINSTGTTPNVSAILDLNTGNTFTSPNGKGLLIPNVSLTGITDNATVTVGATQNSLLVYNTATAGAGTTAVIPGYYYWSNALSKWVPFLSGGVTASSGWLLQGNYGTTAGTNYLGTNDATDLVFKTNSAENMRIVNSTGYMGIGWSAPQAQLSLGRGEIGYCRADAADQTNYGRIGMDNGWVAYLTDNAWWNTATSQYNYVNGGGYGGWAAGIQMVSGQLYFNNASGGTNPLSWNTRMFIAQSGNVGIGTTGPGYKLTVTGGGIGGNYGILPNYAGWAAYGTGDGGAAIYNDNGAYQTLMLVGNNSAGGVRQVSVWDYLTINGNIKINDGSQGSGKILVSDAAGQGTWQAPTSILVYGNNAQSVKLAGMVTNNTQGVYSPIPGASITMTTVHNTFYVFASITARLDQGSGVAAQFGQAIMEVEVVVDGTPVTYAGAVITDYDNTQGVVTTGTVAITGVPVTLAPGVHTITLEWEPVKLWASNPWTMCMNPAAAAADQCILTIFD